MPLESFDIGLAPPVQRPGQRSGALAALMVVLSFGAVVSSAGCSSSSSTPGTGGQVGTGGAAGGSATGGATATGGTSATGGAAGSSSTGGAIGTGGSAGHAGTGGAGGGGGRAGTGGAGGGGGHAATGGAGGGAALTLAQACMVSCMAQDSLGFCADISTVQKCQQDCVTTGTATNPSACQTQLLAMLRCEATLPFDQWTCSVDGSDAIPSGTHCMSTVCPWACCVKSLVADPDIWARCMSTCQ